MIFNGPRLLLSPKRSWPATVERAPGTALWLIAAAITAAVLPAAGVVGGHLGSAILGYADHATATLRAAVGFIAVAGGALVMAPALTLLLLALSNISRGAGTPRSAETVAMGIIWPVWTTGIVLGVPPLLGVGPEIGEAVWVMVAALVAVRTFRAGNLASLGIRRRWRSHFTTRAILSFVILFILVVVGPAAAVRKLLGAEGEIVPTLPERSPLPLPPIPNW
jgi:hypothetical protein